MIHVIATITLHAGTRPRFLELMHKLTPQVLAEQGCIEYGPAIDCASGSPAQIPLRDDVVTVVEKWTGNEALAAHAAAPHMKAFGEDAKDCIASVSLQVLAPSVQ
jgi:quinol monooxygenase YgiN